MPSNRKRVSVSLTPEAYARLEQAAREANATPTTYAASIIAGVLGLELRPPHNPDFDKEKPVLVHCSSGSVLGNVSLQWTLENPPEDVEVGETTTVELRAPSPWQDVTQNAVVRRTERRTVRREDVVNGRVRENRFKTSGWAFESWVPKI